MRSTRLLWTALASVGVAASAWLFVAASPAAKPAASPASVRAVTQPDSAGTELQSPRDAEPLDLGEIDLRVVNGAVELRANQAPRRRVLAQLAHRGGFEVRDFTDADPLVSVELRGSTWQAAIAQTVRDAPYALRFAAPDALGHERIRALEVGVAPSAIAQGANDGRISGDEDAERERERIAKGEPTGGEPSWEVRPATAQETASWLAGRDARRERRRQEVLASLAHESSEERAFAVFSLDPTDPRSLPHLEAALSDTDPSVRLEAIEQLSFASGRDAERALTSALRDSSSQVVVRAIDELALLGGSSARASLRGLTTHRSADVRSAAQAALAQL